MGEETNGETGAAEVMTFNAHVAKGKRGGIRIEATVTQCGCSSAWVQRRRR